MAIPRCRDMVDKYDRAAEMNNSSHSDGIGFIPAMVGLGVIQHIANATTAAAPSSGDGVGASSDNSGMDDGTSAAREIMLLGSGRPGPR